jgi:hypothetical protein
LKIPFLRVSRSNLLRIRRITGKLAPTETTPDRTWRVQFHGPTRRPMNWPRSRQQRKELDDDAKSRDSRRRCSSHLRRSAPPSHPSWPGLPHQAATPGTRQRSRSLLHCICKSIRTLASELTPTARLKSRFTDVPEGNSWAMRTLILSFGLCAIEQRASTMSMMLS